LLQGAKYGVAVDVLSSGFQTGEVEHEVIRAEQTDRPDMIVVEGQGALSHPAFTSSTAIIRGAMPKAIVLQHPPRRKDRCDFPGIAMPIRTPPSTGTPPSRARSFRALPPRSGETAASLLHQS